MKELLLTAANLKDVYAEQQEDADEDAEMEHCKGMEGLVKEATKHTTKEAPYIRRCSIS